MRHRDSDMQLEISSHIFIGLVLVWATYASTITKLRGLIDAVYVQLVEFM